MTTDKWTPTNEAQLSAMIKRKAEIMDKSRDPVQQLSEQFHEWNLIDGVSIVDKLIEHAKQIRHVLEPFDDTFRSRP